MHLPAELTDVRLIAGIVIFIASYVVFAFGKFPGMKIDRPGMAIIGAVLMVAFRVVRADDALKAVNFATIVLLFAMMVIVANLHLVGFFDRIAASVVARLGRAHLLPAVILSTGVLSAFFVNDIICLVMVPIVLKVTRRMGVPPLPYLLAVATASNIGSVATITGNPQNILIGSYSGISYIKFLAHLGPIAAVGLIINWAVLHWMFPLQPPAAVTADPINGVIKPPRELRLAKPAIIVAGVIAGFLFGLPPALVAAVGAAMVLITRTMEPRLIYDEVDWGLLAFFVGLFIIVAGAERVGIVAGMLDLADTWNLHNTLVFTIVTAIMSNIVSNVPAVMLLKSVVPGFPDPHSGWLLLAMASTLAGNLTVTGSIANIIVVERAREEVTITFKDYLRAGVPITVLTMSFGTLWLYLIP
ncbi:MAG TPA: anion transporter [Terriglobales bacterium]|nr:anion transporter [Terriglobales bacterium]